MLVREVCGQRLTGSPISAGHAQLEFATILLSRRVVVSFARNARCREQSFPRRRESISQAIGNTPTTDWDSRLRGNDECFERDPIPNDATTSRGRCLHSAVRYDR
jgi:hypothetical protein